MPIEDVFVQGVAETVTWGGAEMHGPCASGVLQTRITFGPISE